MKKIVLVLVFALVPFIWSSDKNSNELEIKQTILLCEEGENKWGKFKAGKNTIEKVLQGKAEIPKKKKWKRIIKNNEDRFSFYYFDLALFNVIKIFSNSSSPEKVKFYKAGLYGNSSQEFVESLKEKKVITEVYYEVIKEEWDVELSSYSYKEYSPGCRDSFIQSLLFQEKLDKAPWYMRSYPDKKDSWKSLNRETLILRKATGCMDVPGVGDYAYNRSMEKCYISDYEQIKKLNDELIKIENLVQPIVDEVKKESQLELDKIKSVNKI